MITFVDCYGYINTGQKICIGKKAVTLQPVGGQIYYIDNTATGATYTFYDSNGTVISNVQVGDSPAYYLASGTATKDKYYIFYPNAVSNKTWTYKDSSSAWVYNNLGTADGIGTGKANTALVKLADSGAYFNYTDTIWNSLQALNDASTNGCTDWYVPSKTELDALRTATDSSGNPLTNLFSSNFIWSSCEYSTSANIAYDWYPARTIWYNYSKSTSSALVAGRSF